MSFETPSLTESEDLLAAFFKAVFPDQNVGSKHAYHRRRIKVIAAAKTELHAHADSARRDVMPDTATGVYAERWGGILGVDRKGATTVHKDNALRVRGTVGKVAFEGDQLTHSDTGLKFELGEDLTIPSAGFIDVDVRSVDTGSRTRLAAGEVLEFVNTPDGIETQATLQLDLDEDGFDQEQEGAFRSRYLYTFASPRAGGTQDDYVLWALKQTGVSVAFSYPNRTSIGAVDVAALKAGSGTERSLTSAERATLLTALKALAPSQVGALGGSLRVLTTTPNANNVEIAITPNGDSKYAFHWDDSVPPIVSTWDSVTRKLTFTLARPASMQAGHELCIHGIASSQRGEPIVIESLSSTDAVILAKAPTVAPVATDTAYSGGPLVSIIRDAICAHIDGERLFMTDTGPIAESIAESTTGTVDLEPIVDGLGTANPLGVYGTWSGTLLKAVLETIGQYTRGVRRAECVVPVVDVDATDYTYPNDGQIGYITWQEVLVRRKW